MGAEKKPAFAVEGVRFERFRQWINEPQEWDLVSRVDGHFLNSVEARCGRGEKLANPVWRNFDKRFGWMRWHAIEAPAGEVGDEDIWTEMQPRFSKNGPAAWTPVSEVKGRSDGNCKPSCREGVCRARSWTCIQTPTHYLAYDIVGQLQEVFVGGEPRSGCGHGRSLARQHAGTERREIRTLEGHFCNRELRCFAAGNVRPSVLDFRNLDRMGLLGGLHVRE